MKKTVLLWYIFFVYTSCCADNHGIGFPFWKAQEPKHNDFYSQSFMFTRPIYQNIAAQNAAFWHDAVYNKQGCELVSVQSMPLYQHSLHSKATTRYFLFNGKTALTVKGDAVVQNNNERDVRAEWINLPATFNGIFSLEPRQRQAGLWLEVNQDVKKFSDHTFLQAIWVALALPLQYVENKINPRQELLSLKTEQFPATIIQALNAPNLIYGKINPQAHRKFSIPEIYLKIGNSYLQHHGFQLGFYGGAILATTGKQNPAYMFDSFLGHNKHFGFLCGMNAQLPFNTDTHAKIIALIVSIENQFFLRNFQRRTFDLRFKPWSRYLLLNKNDGVMNIPATTILTPKCKVQPFNFFDLTAGIRVQVACAELACGYNLWGHGDEQIELAQPFIPEYGIAGDGTLVPGTNIGATASASTINAQAAIDRDAQGDPTFVPLHDYDLDFDSAAARKALAHRVFFTLGARADYKTVEFFGGFGMYVELPHNNSALRTWGIWAKGGGSF
ncbi:MAG: hypothetical protein AB7R69_02960 [Candidatus Babeliales bacterium]